MTAPAITGYEFRALGRYDRVADQGDANAAAV